MNVNANIAVQHVIQIKNGERKHVNVNIIVKEKKDFSWSPSTCTCTYSRYLKSIADESRIVWDKITCYGYFTNKYQFSKCHKYCANKLLC